MGLFGVVRKTNPGRRSLIPAMAASRLNEKSLDRGIGIHFFPTDLEISGCMEYEGSKPMASP